MSKALGCSAALILALIASIGKCSYDKAKIPDIQKEKLIAAYPEIGCGNAKLSVVKWGEGRNIIDVQGDPSCIDSLRRALTKRNYERAISRNEWYLKDGYWRPGKSEPTVMFDFKQDGRTVRWIREW